MDDGIGCFMGLFIVIILVAFAVGVAIPIGRTRDQECKEFYGSEYVYISGDRSPSLCVSKTNGAVKYYGLIGK